MLKITLEDAKQMISELAELKPPSERRICQLGQNNTKLAIKFYLAPEAEAYLREQYNYRIRLKMDKPPPPRERVCPEENHAFAFYIEQLLARATPLTLQVSRGLRFDDFSYFEGEGAGLQDHTLNAFLTDLVNSSLYLPRKISRLRKLIHTFKLSVEQYLSVKRMIENFQHEWDMVEVDYLPRTSVNDGVAAAPTCANAMSPEDAASQFLVADAGTYSYKISAVYKEGETLPSTNFEVAVAAGDRVTVEITYTGAPLYFVVYRSAKGNTSKWHFLQRIAKGNSGAAHTIDLNLNAEED